MHNECPEIAPIWQALCRMPLMRRRGNRARGACAMERIARPSRGK